jgi:hypothetical protein
MGCDFDHKPVCGRHMRVFVHTVALLLKWARCFANSVAEQFEHLLPWLLS